MIDDELVLRVERLRDSIEAFKTELRRRYAKKTSLVAAAEMRTGAAQLAERWLVDVAARDDVKAAIPAETLADLNVQFQRLLTNSERMNARKKYDDPISGILTDFRSSVILALKQGRGVNIPSRSVTNASAQTPRSAFIGQSFADNDAKVNESVRRFLIAYGLTVATGEKPSADTVSAKVKMRIDAADMFVGIFTRRDKLAARNEWAPSAWVVDEKAYALAKDKRLILLKEKGVNSVGGLQGDYEYLEFERTDLADLLVRLLEVLRGLEK
jgi:hypothetical protein